MKEEDYSFFEQEELQTTNQIIEEDKEDEKIIIHITGQVVNPGIVTLKQGDRVINAIEKAGGQTEHADVSKINLAQVLEDGMKVYIPSINDEEEQITEIRQESRVVRVNINTATVSELEKISGIGASIANRIIEYRKENGKFKSIEDLKNVSGIGESKFNNIKSYVYVK